LLLLAVYVCLLLVVLMQVKSTLKHDFLGKIMPFCKKTRKILHFLKKKVVFVLVIQKLFLTLHTETQR